MVRLIKGREPVEIGSLELLRVAISSHDIKVVYIYIASLLPYRAVLLGDVGFGTGAGHPSIAKWLYQDVLSPVSICRGFTPDFAVPRFQEGCCQVSVPVFSLVADGGGPPSEIAK